MENDNNKKAQEKSKSSIIVFVLVAIVIVGIAVYALTNRKNNNTVPEKTASENENSVVQSSQETVDSSEQTVSESKVNFVEAIISLAYKSPTQIFGSDSPIYQDESHDVYSLKVEGYDPIYLYYTFSDHSKPAEFTCSTGALLPDVDSCSSNELKQIFGEGLSEPVANGNGYNVITVSYNDLIFEFLGYDRGVSTSYDTCTVYNSKEK